ncbi:hypothetical protein SAMN05192588_2792 [Nonlabens sp. Hel1_33_55]|uniref:hypothetical protein n=1 Tax=Nonlabens sp. Hel1_33_55 TaxID=1336802 RepID=UPI000875C3AD|nr:hypothetical protein [Nonlabens sp. Hel1_33_55]SCY42133.1 hypothetical protein SAMN05192588_2792 [Nonlabens sp. Hel1_33_55]
MILIDNLLKLNSWIVEKSATILESMLINKPMIDGNKCNGWVLMRSLLFNKSYKIKGARNLKYDFTIQDAEGKLNTNQISEWIKSNTTSNQAS